jgi:hypothetical protein
MYISKGNQKVIDTRIFNLPCRATCPGATEFCSNKCYANKAERFYPQTKIARAKNLEDSKNPHFVAMVVGTVYSFNKPVEYFRIHESGDFYSQEYLESWFEICRNFPKIKFLAYTKSYMLDFSNRPENLQILYSIMPDTVHVVAGMPIAYAGCNAESATLECRGECGKCRACWKLKAGQSVYFKIH